jgi:methylated-DNA-[protein]-cysteine S-methyltransferase
MSFIYYQWMESPVGRLKLVAEEEAVTAILFAQEDPNRVRLGPFLEEVSGHPLLAETERQLGEYFQGLRQQFTLKLNPVGTAFQRQVWQGLLTIPYGETRTYTEVAGQIGRPRAARAMGAANGRNPISIIIPCHRVIGASGDLTGFAGGIAAKRYLLTLENKV